MTKAELKKLLTAYEDLDRDAAIPFAELSALIDTLPGLKGWREITLVTEVDGDRPCARTHLAIEQLKGLATFLTSVGARKSDRGALDALILVLDRHQSLDLGVIIERATSEARRPSSIGKSSGRKMSNAPENASAFADRLSDFTRTSAEAEDLLAQLASRTTSKAVAVDVAKRLTGRRFNTKKDAVDALKRWRWQWARTRSISKAIASGA